MRHAFDRWGVDPDDRLPHCVKKSWRSMADTEIQLEEKGDEWMQDLLDFHNRTVRD